MLVLNRKHGEEIVIGDSIRVTVIEVRGNRVKLGFSGPRDVRILRGEIFCGEDLQSVVESEMEELASTR